MSEHLLMNCLICRHCQLRPDTDMAHPSPVSGCGVADERYEYSGKIRIGGDRIRNWNDAADAYLKAHYNRAPMKRLVLALRRAQSGIYHRAGRLGLSNQERRQTTAAQLGRSKRGTHPSWTPAQLDWLRDRYARADWPTFWGCGESDRAHRDRERQVIVDTVAELGPFHSWQMIEAKCRVLFTPKGAQSHAAYCQRAARSEAAKRAARRAMRQKETA
jgi:hypothetical protein